METNILISDQSHAKCFRKDHSDADILKVWSCFTLKSPSVKLLMQTIKEKLHSTQTENQMNTENDRQRVAEGEEESTPQLSQDVHYPMITRRAVVQHRTEPREEEEGEEEEAELILTSETETDYTNEDIHSQVTPGSATTGIAYSSETERDASTLNRSIPPTNTNKKRKISHIHSDSKREHQYRLRRKSPPARNRTQRGHYKGARVVLNKVAEKTADEDFCIISSDFESLFDQERRRAWIIIIEECLAGCPRYRSHMRKRLQEIDRLYQLEVYYTDNNSGDDNGESLHLSYGELSPSTNSNGDENNVTQWNNPDENNVTALLTVS